MSMSFAVTISSILPAWAPEHSEISTFISLHDKKTTTNNNQMSVFQDKMSKAGTKVYQRN